jgi:Tfp pilus assembly protein PilF
MIKMNKRTLLAFILALIASSSFAVTKKSYFNYNRPVVSDYLWGILSSQAANTASVKKYFDKAYSETGSDHIRINLALELIRSDEPVEGYNILNDLFDKGFDLGRSGIYLYLYEFKKGNKKRAETVLDSVLAGMLKDKEIITAAAVLNQKINDRLNLFSDTNEFKSMINSALENKYGRAYDLYFSMIKMQICSRADGNTEKISEIIASLEKDQPELPYLIYRYAFDEYIFNKKFDKAAEMLEKMTRITYGEPEYFADIAELYSEKGDFTKARNTLLDGIKEYPESSLLLQLAELYVKSGDVLKAKIVYNGLKKRFPEGTYLYQIMATVFSRYKMEAECLEAYKEGILKDPENAELLNNYSYQLAQNSLDLDKAAEYIEKALKNRPGSVTFLDTKAWIYYKSGKIEEAEKIMDGIFENADVLNDPSSEELLEHLKVIKKALNKAGEIDNIQINKTAIMISDIILKSSLILKAAL